MTSLPISTLPTKAEIPRTKPEMGAPESLPELNDLRIRMIGIPFFGMVIPNATGLFGPLGPRTLSPGPATRGSCCWRR
jgi:hypothetical protein